MTHSIKIITERLSDGSEVFAVAINGMVINAITQPDAIEMAEKITAAIDAHSIDNVVRDNRTADFDYDWTSG